MCKLLIIGINFQKFRYLVRTETFIYFLGQVFLKLLNDLDWQSIHTLCFHDVMQLDQVMTRS